MTILNINGNKLQWLGHSSFLLECGKRIYMDPFNVGEGQADIILVTHGHYDHCSVEDIKKLVREDTLIITTPDTISNLASRLSGGKPVLITPGEKMKIGDIEITAVPAYNIGKQFHAKENGWVGYLITANNVRFYHAGDTDLIPEMATFSCDVAMLPVGGTYTMTAEEAAKAAELVKAKVAIPMHYGGIVGTNEDAERFKTLCKCRVAVLG